MRVSFSSGCGARFMLRLAFFSYLSGHIAPNSMWCLRRVEMTSGTQPRDCVSQSARKMKRAGKRCVEEIGC